MPKKVVSISENVISVDFSPKSELKTNTPLALPRDVIISFSPEHYDFLTEEAEQTGLNKTTVTNMALSVYEQIMTKQREGFLVAFIDNAMENAEVFRFVDARDRQTAGPSAEVLPFTEPTEEQ